MSAVATSSIFARIKSAFKESFLVKALTLTISVALIATIGFYLLETWGGLQPEPFGWTEALMWTIATFTTIGYGDVTPLTWGGKIFSIFIAIYGAAVWTMLIVYIISWVINSNKRVRDKKVVIELDVTKSMVGKTFGQLFTSLKTEENLILIGVWRDRDDMKYFNPSNNFKVETDDTLIVVREKNLSEKVSLLDL